MTGAPPLERHDGAAGPVPELVAHRGYTARYPENTLIGLEAAVACGAAYVEVDVQLSADRVPVLFHDGDLERVCGVAGAVHERAWPDLASLHASEPRRFGTRFGSEPLAPLTALVDLLRRHPALTAFVEAKQEAIDHFGSRTVLDAITGILHPVHKQCVLISFSLEFLALARARTPQRLGGVIERWADRGHPQLRSVRPEFLFCDRTGLPPEGALVPGDGTCLAVYEVADADEALALAARGVDLIETFAICELRRRLQHRTATPRRHA